MHSSYYCTSLVQSSVGGECFECSTLESTKMPHVSEWGNVSTVTVVWLFVTDRLVRAHENRKAIQNILRKLRSISYNGWNQAVLVEVPLGKALLMGSPTVFTGLWSWVKWRQISLLTLVCVCVTNHHFTSRLPFTAESRVAFCCCRSSLNRVSAFRAASYCFLYDWGQFLKWLKTCDQELMLENLGLYLWGDAHLIDCLHECTGRLGKVHIIYIIPVWSVL